MESIEKLDLKSMNIPEEKLKQLKSIFPEVFTEGNKIDFEKLKLTLGEQIDSGKERFGMNWPGKADCFKIIQQPSIATLVPCREESVDFDNTENLFIEGDNLEVLKLLQKSYLGKIKMIYIDPPYNTGNDFIYPDDYSETLDTYLRYTGQIDSEGRKYSTNVESDGRFHSKWMNMMYPRLFLARNLLAENGMVFISINDKEAANLKKICDEIFGEENFIAQFVWNTEGHTDNQFHIKINHEYIFVYVKNESKRDETIGYVIDPNTREQSNLWKGFAENSITKNGPGNPYSIVELPVGFPCKVNEASIEKTIIPNEFYKEIEKIGYISREIRKRYDLEYPIKLDNIEVKEGFIINKCKVLSGWANVNKLKKFIDNQCQPLDEEEGKYRFYLSEKGVIYYKKEREKARNILSVLRNMGTTEQMSSLLENIGINFKYPKPIQLLKYLTEIGSDNGDFVLDFFAGSCTTAHAVLELNRENIENRKFIMIQLPELLNNDSAFPNDNIKTIADIGKECIRRVIKKIKQEKEQNTNLFENNVNKLDLGFKVFKLQSSNFKIWDSQIEKDTEAIAKQLEMHVDHIDPDRSQEDILYEILLKSGFPLTTKIEKLILAEKNVFSIAEGAMLICLEKELTPEAIKAMAELEPSRVVCLDEGFKGNDQLKTNAVQIMKSKKVDKFQTV